MVILSSFFLLSSSSEIQGKSSLEKTVEIVEWIERKKELGRSNNEEKKKGILVKGNWRSHWRRYEKKKVLPK